MSKPNAPSPESQDADVVDLMADPQFLAFLEANGCEGLDPLSDEGLRVQANYVKLVGDHPLDILKTLAKNPFVKPSDRINAAKTLLEYGARKIPAQFELTSKNTALVIDPSQFSALSAKELETLEKLLGKAQGAAK